MPDSHSQTQARAIAPDSRAQRLAAFTDWASQHITGDEKGEAHIFLDRLFQAFGQPGCLDVGGQPEFRIKKGKESTGGTSFADYVWRPTVLIEMKKRAEPLARLSAYPASPRSHRPTEGSWPANSYQLLLPTTSMGPLLPATCRSAISSPPSG